MATNRFNVGLQWFDDDSEDTDVSAATIDEAARKVWDEWHVTGWTSATVSGGGEVRYVDLTAAEYVADRG